MFYNKQQRMKVNKNNCHKKSFFFKFNYICISFLLFFISSIFCFVGGEEGFLIRRALGYSP